MGTHVHPWLIHVSVWQNQYSIVKQNKVKKNKNKKQANIIEHSIPGRNACMVHKHRQRSSTHQQLGKSEDYSEFPLTPARLVK